jgi:predicted RNase H-like nuclease (RuvC/YqgF family)
MTKTALLEENRQLKAKLHQKDLEIAELIHMHREIDKRMDGLIKDAAEQRENTSWLDMFFLT